MLSSDLSSVFINVKAQKNIFFLIYVFELLCDTQSGPDSQLEKDCSTALFFYKKHNFFCFMVTVMFVFAGASTQYGGCTAALLPEASYRMLCKNGRYTETKNNIISRGAGKINNRSQPQPVSLKNCRRLEFVLLFREGTSSCTAGRG